MNSLRSVWQAFCIAFGVLFLAGCGGSSSTTPEITVNIAEITAQATPDEVQCLACITPENAINVAEITVTVPKLVNRV
jgi:PBP1b-binding outer membrane lipoprotein LpoB